MPAKRSRLMRSDSFGDSEVVTPMPRPPAASSEWQSSPIVAGAFPTLSEGRCRSEDQQPPSIFSISSPVREQAAVGGGGADFGLNFMERCYFCNKKIFRDAEVYMYRDLRAFCALECRYAQIYMDRGCTDRARARKRAKDMCGRHLRMENSP